MVAEDIRQFLMGQGLEHQGHPRGLDRRWNLDGPLLARGMDILGLKKVEVRKASSNRR